MWYALLKLSAFSSITCLSSNEGWLFLTGEYWLEDLRTPNQTYHLTKATVHCYYCFLERDQSSNQFCPCLAISCSPVAAPLHSADISTIHFASNEQHNTLLSKSSSNYICLTHKYSTALCVKAATIIWTAWLNWFFKIINYNSGSRTDAIDLHYCLPQLCGRRWITSNNLPWTNVYTAANM